MNIFMTAGMRAKEEDLSNKVLTIHNTHGKDMRRYNQPTASEISAIIFDHEQRPRDIVIQYREGQLKHISELYGPYDPLQYPLLFPHGEFGWHNDILRANTILPESVIPMDMDVDVDERVDEEEVEQHTGATQDIANLSLGLPFSLDDPLIRSSKDKGKGKEKEIESVEFDNNDKESEPESIIYGDEDLESLEI